MKKLTREFYNNRTIEVAPALLGKYLVHRVQGKERIGKIVEVEAYLGPHDLACHTSKGRTKRNEVMYGPPGFSYVYLIYGIYHCINAVTEPEGSGSAVLIRALEPIENIELSTRGPGLLCKAMEINLSHNRQDLLGNSLYILEEERAEPFEIVTTPRIGVHYAQTWRHELLRFYIKDNPYVSRIKRAKSL